MSCASAFFGVHCFAPGGALGQLPVVLEEVLEKAVVPLRRLLRPRALEAARQRLRAVAVAGAVLPAETLLLERRGLGLGAEVARVDGAVRLAERVPADDQRDRLFVVHRHASERLADVLGRRERVGVAVRALRVDVDQAHLHGAERSLELAPVAVALVAEPRVLAAPVDLLGLPDVLAAEAEAERLKAHRLHRDVARVDEQVGPGDLAAVLLLDRPQEPARLVEARVVGPAVQRREALRALAAAAAPVGDPVGAGGVPAHADEQRAVVAVVRRPPVLRGAHQLDQVALQRVEVERRELLRVVEALAHRVRQRRVAVQHGEVELVRPPVVVRPRVGHLGGRARDCRVLALADALSHVVRVPFCFSTVAEHGIGQHVRVESGTGDEARWAQRRSAVEHGLDVVPVGVEHDRRSSPRHSAGAAWGRFRARRPRARPRGRHAPARSCRPRRRRGSARRRRSPSRSRSPSLGAAELDLARQDLVVSFRRSRAARAPAGRSRGFAEIADADRDVVEHDAACRHVLVIPDRARPCTSSLPCASRAVIDSSHASQGHLLAQPDALAVAHVPLLLQVLLVRDAPGAPVHARAK